MSKKLPYVPAPGLIEKLFEKIIEAPTPDRFGPDFLGTKLGMTGGSAGALIPLLKKISFLNSDGTPTNCYRDYRSEETRGPAMASAIRSGYAELFSRNEYANELDRVKLADLVNNVTGAEKGNKVDQLTVSTFWNLKELANFEAKEEVKPVPVHRETHEEAGAFNKNTMPPNDQNFGMNLSYTINLNLPETTDPEVFNAIFKSLKENLLSEK